RIAAVYRDRREIVSERGVVDAALLSRGRWSHVGQVCRVFLYPLDLAFGGRRISGRARAAGGIGPYTVRGTDLSVPHNAGTGDLDVIGADRRACARLRRVGDVEIVATRGLHEVIVTQTVIRGRGADARNDGDTEESHAKVGGIKPAIVENVVHGCRG